MAAALLAAADTAAAQEANNGKDAEDLLLDPAVIKAARGVSSCARSIGEQDQDIALIADLVRSCTDLDLIIITGVERS